MTVSADTVNQYYTGIFRQAPSSAVSAAYQAMADATTALNSMLSAANASVDPVVRLYQTAFNRLPDNAGFTAWVVPFSTGAITLQSIANGFTQSTEFTTIYPTSMTNAQYVGALYYNILQRAGDDVGMAGWINALNTGALTRAQVLLGFSDSAEFKSNVESNVNAFLTNIANTPVADQGSAALYSGNLFDVNGGTPGATYTLTTNIDTIDITGQKVDTVIGIQNAVAASETWNTGDTINGNGHTKINLVGSTNTASIVDANDIASINVNVANNTTIDALEFTNVKAINISNGVAAKTLTINNADVATVYGTGVARDFTYAINYANVTGKADTATLAATGTGTKDVDTTFDVSSGNAIEAVKLATAGTNYLTLNAGTGAASVTVSGAGTNELTIGSAKTTLTLDASATTGSNTLVLGTQLSTADTVKGGTGADQLNGTVSGAGQYLTTVSGIETLQLDFTAAGIYNFQNTAGVTELQLNLEADATVSNITASVVTVAVEETTATASNVTASYKAGTTSDVALKIGASDSSSATTLAVDVGTVTLNGTSGTVTVTSIGEADNAVDGLAFDKAAAVIITASAQGLTNSGTTAFTKASSIELNASADDLTFTGDITASVDVSKAKFTATGSGNVLLVDGGAGAFTGTRSVAAIEIAAVTAGVVTIDELGWNGKDVDGNSISTSMTISADADSTVTVSAMDDNGGDDITVSSLSIAGAGDVNIGTGTALGTTINITEITSTLTGSLVLDATSIDAAMTVSLGNAATNEQNTVTTGSAADYVAGGTGIDVVVLGDGADVFISNGGKDTVTGLAADDTITLATGVQTVVFVTGGATTIADYATANGSDTIVSFTTGASGDVIKFEQALKSINATTTIAYQTGATDAAIAAGTTVYELAGVTTNGTAAGLVTALGTAATNADLDAGDALVFINYTTGGDAQLWYFVDGSGADVAAAELTLIGTLNSVTAGSFASGNITA